MKMHIVKQPVKKTASVVDTSKHYEVAAIKLSKAAKQLSGDCPKPSARTVYNIRKSLEVVHNLLDAAERGEFVNYNDALAS